jgi:hypothetical protein
VAGPIVVPANDSDEVTLQIDLAHNLVPLGSADGIGHYLLRPDLRPMALSSTAAIVGVIDKTQFCPADAPGPGCIHDAVATVLLPSPDGRYEHEVRSAPVVVADSGATFALYPLPVGTTADVLIRGRNMQTMVVRGVPVAPFDLLQAPPTQLGGNPGDPQHPAAMVPVLRPEGDATVTASLPPAGAGTQLVFVQTLPGGLPLEIASANPDPFAPTVTVALPSGPLRVATYTDQAVLSFSDVSPVEGDNHFGVTALGTSYQDASPFATFGAPAGTVTALSPATPATKAGLASATLTVQLSAGATSGLDAAQLVVSDVNGIVATRDVASLIGHGGSVTVSLPAGSAAAALGGTATYSVAVRAWQQSAPTASLKWSRVATAVDLRAGTDASVSLALP